MYGAVRSGSSPLGGGGRAAPYEKGHGKACHVGGDQRGSWTCRHCSNVNYAARDVCNTRKCAQHRSVADSKLKDSPDGSWLCVGCENVNYPSRTVCNTKRCAMPKPDLEDKALVVIGSIPASAGPFTEPGSDWACGRCGNVNFGHRDVCNSRNCRAPRPGLASDVTSTLPLMAAGGDWTCPSCGNVNFGNRTVCNTRYCQAPREAVATSDWTCPGCGNVNFAHRDICNTRACRMPRGGVGAGPPLAFSLSTIRPPLPAAEPSNASGSWTCAGCGNVNYGYRAECNTRSCQLPRPEAAVGQGGSSASWLCTGCGNVNYDHRAVCNTRKCRLPRPEAA